eukprot:RCo027112
MVGRTASRYPGICRAVPRVPFFRLVQEVVDVRLGQLVSLLGQLSRHKPRIHPVRDGQQLGVRAGLHNTALTHHCDAVGVDHSGEAVGHEHHGASPVQAMDQGIQGLLHQGLTLRVQRARRLVQEHKLGLPQHHSGNRDALLLAPAQSHPTLSHPSAVAFLEAHDKVMRVGQPGRLVELFPGVVRHPVGDVVLDRGCEELSVLGNDAGVAVQPLHVQLGQGAAVQQHLAFVRVVKPQQQMDDRGLAPTGPADNRGDLVGLTPQAQTPENFIVRPRPVSKVNVLQLQLPVQRGEGLATAQVNLGGQVDHRQHPLRRPCGASEAVQDPVEGLVGRAHRVLIQLESDQLAHRELPVRPQS